MRQIINSSKTAVFTIVSKNYLSFARTLLHSVEQHHPEWDRYLLLVDEVEDKFDIGKEPFEVLTMSDINLPDMKKFIFRYTILELNTAVKPSMFLWLFNQNKYDNVVYIDPDIYLYDRMTEVEEALNDGNLMVLTPHLTGFLDDNKKPSEQNILQAGTYNLGFLAVSNHADTSKFLNWWKDKLEFDCTVDLANGLFVDQKWMDLVPGFFKDVSILHHPGYNVAYWNLNHRTVEKQSAKYVVNGERLVFFHYSGVNPSKPDVFSKHQNRFTINNIGEAKGLVKDYADKVLSHNFKESTTWNFYYNSFENGIKINDFVRISYRNSVELQNRCGDEPFKCSKIFLEEQSRVEDREQNLPLISHVMYTLWNSRPDLKNVFPDIFGKDRIAYCHWFIDSANREYSFTEDYINPVVASLSQIKVNNVEQAQQSQQSSIHPTVSMKNTLYKKLYHLSLKTKPLLLRMVNDSQKEKLRAYKEKLQRKAYFSEQQPLVQTLNMQTESEKKEQFEPGINLIGYSRSETGVGESSRLAARAYDRVNLPFGIINYNTGNLANCNDLTWAEREMDHAKHNVNIFHINADQMPVAFDTLGKEVFEGKYNIGYWHWELPDFPDEWLNSFNYVNEIWAPSQFIVDAISEKSPVPVVKIPHGIELTEYDTLNREKLRLPEDCFLFLTMYDTYSFQERKNPISVIESFKKSFRKDDRSVGLVIKVNHSDNNSKGLTKLEQLIEGYQNIYLVKGTLSRSDVNSLINCTDCFVSLHRSEGFGLGLAEAMYLGKPVIGTHWSANTDFMNHRNSCVVDYRLVQIGEDLGPYKAYQYWADPDIEHASYYMKKLVGDKSYYERIGLAGQETIRNLFSPEVVGNKVKKRLQYLGLL